jgi:hypothetical protein
MSFRTLDSPGFIAYLGLGQGYKYSFYPYQQQGLCNSIIRLSFWEWQLLLFLALY